MNMFIRKTLSCLTQAALTYFVIAPPCIVLAQGYPSRTVRIIVPVPPGGANDTLTRAIVPPLAAALGRALVIDNRPGGNTTLGTDVLAKSPPDGHTLMMAPSAHTVNASLYRTLPYDPIKDFEAVSLVAQTPLLLTVHPSLPVKNVKELAALARARPGQLNYASAGNGTSGHLAGELFATVLKARLTHIPYKGGAPAMVDLIGGHVQLLFGTLQLGIAHTATGKVRGLATTGAKRSAQAPHLPTMAEQGLPEVEIVSWFGMLAPMGTPKDIITRLHQELRKVMNSREVSDRLSALGYESHNSTPEEFAAFLKTDLARWAKVVRTANIRVEQ